MIRWVTFALLVLTGSSSLASECPSKALGLVKNRVNGEVSVYATAKAKIDCAACDRGASSITAARIEAKALLASDADVKKINGQLSGVVDDAICSDGGLVFVTVLYTGASSNKALHINNEILRSIEAAGANVPLNLGDSQESMAGDFQRLLGQPAETISR